MKYNIEGAVKHYIHFTYIHLHVKVAVNHYTALIIHRSVYKNLKISCIIVKWQSQFKHDKHKRFSVL